MSNKVILILILIIILILILSCILVSPRLCRYTVYRTLLYTSIEYDRPLYRSGESTILLPYWSKLYWVINYARGRQEEERMRWETHCTEFDTRPEINEWSGYATPYAIHMQCVYISAVSSELRLHAIYQADGVIILEISSTRIKYR